MVPRPRFLGQQGVRIGAGNLGFVRAFLAAEIDFWTARFWRYEELGRSFVALIHLAAATIVFRKVPAAVM